MDFFGQCRTLFESLSFGQRLGTLAAFAGIAVTLGVLANFLTADAFAPLYLHLSSDDAARVVEQLKAENVPYRLSDAGTTIKVPESKVYDLRLKLSMSGLPNGGGSGFELFDKAALGMTDFAQQVNYQRALQGELSRTISELESVKSARVLLVFPESSPFLDDDKAASASVVLALHPGAVLDKRQIQGIVHLVAGAVKGLHAEDVTVVDAYGSLLSGAQKPGSLLGTGDQMLQIQHDVEDYLESKGLSMLDRVLGPDKSVLRISALLDTQVIKEQSEAYDPSSVIRSEQQATEKTGGNSESVIKNYEIGRTVRQVVASPGSIKKLTISLVVDGTYKEDAAKPGTQTYTPRSADELKNLEDLVKDAVGFSDDREDKIEVRNLPFDTHQKQVMDAQMVDIQKQTSRDRLKEQGFTLAGRAVLAGAMLVIVIFMLKTVKQTSLQAIAARPALLPAQATNTPAAIGAPSTVVRPPGSLPAGTGAANAAEIAAPAANGGSASLPAPVAATPDPSAMMGDLVKAAKDNPAEVARLIQRNLSKK